MGNRIYYGDAFKSLCELKDESVDLVYVRLPSRISINKKYVEKHEIEDLLKIGSISYDGNLRRYLLGMAPFFIEAKRKLKETGTFYLHGENEKTHYIKALLLDRIFSRNLFLNEIVWVTEKKTRESVSWPQKHEGVLIYGKSLGYKYNVESIDRIEYMAPNLVSKAKRESKKLPTDTWWFTQITDEGMLKRLIASSTDEKDVVLALFPKDGLFSKISLDLKREFIIIEKSKRRAKIMWDFFYGINSIEWIGNNPFD